VRLLLDTHAALWWLGGDARFSDAAAAELTRDDAEVLLSAAVVWEVAIKRSLGMLRAPHDLAPTLLRAGARPLPATLDHAAAVAQLPSHHRDPFDRMLVAQATLEGATLVSGDSAMRAYGVPVVW
jgi:PIN domain nuclease of toxin-antitoxin system